MVKIGQMEVGEEEITRAYNAQVQATKDELASHIADNKWRVEKGNLAPRTLEEYRAAQQAALTKVEAARTAVTPLSETVVVPKTNTASVVVGDASAAVVDKGASSTVTPKSSVSDTGIDLAADKSVAHVTSSNLSSDDPAYRALDKEVTGGKPTGPVEKVVADGPPANTTTAEVKPTGDLATRNAQKEGYQELKTLEKQKTKLQQNAKTYKARGDTARLASVENALEKIEARTKQITAGKEGILASGVIPDKAFVSGKKPTFWDKFRRERADTRAKTAVMNGTGAAAAGASAATGAVTDAAGSAFRTLEELKALPPSELAKVPAKELYAAERNFHIGQQNLARLENTVAGKGSLIAKHGKFWGRVRGTAGWTAAAAAIVAAVGGLAYFTSSSRGAGRREAADDLAMMNNNALMNPQPDYAMGGMPNTLMGEPLVLNGPTSQRVRPGPAQGFSQPEMASPDGSTINQMGA